MDSRIEPLRYAAKDAEDFYAWIVSSQGGKYSPANVKLLIIIDFHENNIQ